MIYYFLLLNRHKNLSLKRKSDYKRNAIMTSMVMIFLMLSVIMLLITFPKEDIETFSAFWVQSIIILDFSLRFFLKRNASAAIVPYLTLSIPRKTLIGYIILSDLLRFWIWGCGLIYNVILCYCGVLTFGNAMILLFFMLLNNYLVAFIKALIDGYAILIYPVGLGFIFVISFIVNILNPIFAIVIVALTALFWVVALFYTLKENLYKELNSIAL